MNKLAYAEAGVMPEGYRPMTEEEAARDETLDTRDEPWCLKEPEQGHIYRASCEFASRHLGVHKPRTLPQCLVIGSPLFEAQELSDDGWVVTVVDVRNPGVPKNQRDWAFIQGDASSIPFPNENFDAVSSTCCLCHVGLGRYGDPIVPDGDRKALKEFHRVLRPGGRAAITFGPSLLLATENRTLGRVHRIYSPDEARAMAEETGFVIKDEAVWCSHERRWLNWRDRWERIKADLKLVNTGEVFYYCYLMMLLGKA